MTCFCCLFEPATLSLASGLSHHLYKSVLDFLSITFLHLRLELPLQHGCNTTAVCIMHQYTALYHCLFFFLYCSTFDLEGRLFSHLCMEESALSQSTRYWRNVAKNAYAEGFREPCQIAKISRGFKRLAYQQT